MGWYALWKWFSPWSKRNIPDMAYWYRESVLKTPEQREKEKQMREERAKEALATLGLMANVMDYCYARTGWRW